MLPVAIFRFSPTEGPAYFAEWLDANGVPWELIAVDQADRVPERTGGFAGLAMMGGPMSVNDPLPWRDALFALIREAVDRRIPVLGHCLGGQLLSAALGGSVVPAAKPEIGWIDVAVCDVAAAREWFGGRERFTTFQWHYDAFTLPPRATRVITNAYNAQQGYVVDDRHIGLQCHVEMTPQQVDAWCEGGVGELPAESHDALQSARDIRRRAPALLPELHAVADSIYARWARDLVQA